MTANKVCTDLPGMLRLVINDLHLDWHLPSFPIDGQYVKAERFLYETIYKGNRVLEYALTEEISLKIELAEYENAPFCRIRYRLEGEGHFTTTDRDMPILYGGISCNADALTEIQLSNFDRINHTFKPTVERYDDGLQYNRSFIGPIVIAENKARCCLVAYEHGAEAPDHFLHFVCRDNELQLYSTKGNYFKGQSYNDYESAWIQIGFSEDIRSLQTAYRKFMLDDICPLSPNREPYIFYNTWNNQERDKYFHHKPYLTAMTQEHMLAEIDIAHELGIEYFVIDTGWYQKTGDWEVNLNRFPDALKAIREKLDAYGMKLGLWFNPIVAAQTSYPRVRHPEWTVEKDGVESFWGKIWETEESYAMCLVSDYADYFIEQLVRLHDTLGVCYFKWDAIGQYGCDCAHHNHGTDANSAEERLDSYAYQMGLRMLYIAEEVTRRCPGSIIDFDITEGGRFVGLGFLSVGKYFLINNGPYFSSFDIPNSVSMEPNTINVFFYPGSARPQVCRSFTQFDPWIPSTLFLTHFLPEGDAKARRNSQASLVLGGNGIWGDLLHLTEEEILDWKRFLVLYKQVRHDVSRANPIVRGWAGASPEFHEKLDPASGRGVICCFCRTGGTFHYITRKLCTVPISVIGADDFNIRSDGRVEIIITLSDNDAQTIFFI